MIKIKTIIFSNKIRYKRLYLVPIEPRAIYKPSRLHIAIAIFSRNLFFCDDEYNSNSALLNFLRLYEPEQTVERI
jgi:hypothetical protein